MLSLLVHPPHTRRFRTRRLSSFAVIFTPFACNSASTNFRHCHHHLHLVADEFFIFFRFTERLNPPQQGLSLPSRSRPHTIHTHTSRDAVQVSLITQNNFVIFARVFTRGIFATLLSCLHIRHCCCRLSNHKIGTRVRRGP